MTLISYDPARLDQLALRLLDVASTIRGVAQTARENDRASIALHDKKALEWLANLEAWCHRVATEAEMDRLRRKSEELARQLPAAGAAKRRSRTAASRKN